MRRAARDARGWQADGVDGRPGGRRPDVRVGAAARRARSSSPTGDGRIAGSVSGGCVEGAAYEEIERARRDGVSRVIRYGISDEQAWDVGLACGGTIDVLVEPAIRPEVVAARRGDDATHGRAIVTPLPADAPGSGVRAARAAGPGSRPRPRSSSATTAR